MDRDTTNEERLDQVVQQLTEFRFAYRSHHDESVPVRAVLAITGELTRSYSEFLGKHGIELWDRDKLLSMLRRTSSETAVRLQKILEGEYRSHREPEDRVRATELTDRLSLLDCGKANWSLYQRFCVEVLEQLFSPPLERAIYESSNESKVNKRDIILPNYSTDDFWLFMRSEYAADYVVVDAKNSCFPIGKASVLQVTNYMSERGTGLFGIIMCRKGDKRSSQVTRREQWILHRKLVIVLTDDDVRQALTNVEQGIGADIVLRQKIEDFRLAI